MQTPNNIMKSLTNEENRILIENQNINDAIKAKQKELNNELLLNPTIIKLKNEISALHTKSNQFQTKLKRTFTEEQLAILRTIKPIDYFSQY